jgi:ariadne-1
MSDDSWEWEEDEDYRLDIDESEPQLFKGVSYVIMNEKDIALRQIEAIEAVSDMLGFTRTQAAYLLSKYEWNPNEVCQKVIDGKCKDLELLMRSKTRVEDDVEVTCQLCYFECLGKDIVSMECGHGFCFSCYTGYLENELLIGRECVFSTCPMQGCNIIVSEELYEELLPSNHFKKYKRFLLRSYVEDNSKVKWCPAPGCDYAVEYPKHKARSILCRCGYAWCFKCGKESHRPLICEILSKWDDMNSGKDDLDMNWILANTKQCPKCSTPIQKNAGCMHMTCTCGHEFCWLCTGPWSDHGSQTGGYYDCNKFTKNRELGLYKEEERKKFLAAESAKRFEHYSNRFLEHKLSLKFAYKKKKDLIAFVSHIMEAVTSANPSQFEVLEEAADLIIEARSAVCYSYPLGFFLNSFSKIQFYEFLQGELERSLEMLDKKTEIQERNFLLELDGKVQLSEEYFIYKGELKTIINLVRNHFDKSLEQMEAGFPEIRETNLDTDIEEMIMMRITTQQVTHWYCPACTFANERSVERCGVCNALRPQQHDN